MLAPTAKRPPLQTLYLRTPRTVRADGIVTVIARVNTPGAAVWLATRYGVGAIEMVHRGEFGRMVSLRGNKIVSVPLKDAVGRTRTVDDDLINVAQALSDRRGAGTRAAG